MRTDDQRIASYETKTNPVTVAPVVTAQLPTMKSGFSSAVQSLAALEMQIQTALNGAGVPTIQYPFFMNFGREMWSLARKGMSGTTLTMMAQSLKEKYTSYGLLEAALIQYAADWFQLTLT